MRRSTLLMALNKESEVRSQKSEWTKARSFFQQIGVSSDVAHALERAMSALCGHVRPREGPSVHKSVNVARTSARATVLQAAFTRNRTYRLEPVVLSALLGFGVMIGCGWERDAPRTVISSAEAAGAPVAGMAHGNHIPKYGGVVLMNGELHFEVVASSEGHYTLYFSDATRQELPASAVAGVTLAIQRPGFRAEMVDMKINETGESWIGASGSVDDRGTDIRIAYTYRGKPCTSTMPFFAAEAQKASMQHP